MNKTNMRLKANRKTSTALYNRLISNKWVVLAFIAIIASIGSYLVFFSQAAPNNCQTQEGVPICDVDLVAGVTDVVIGVGEEPQRLGRDGWGMYFGPAFRAPTKPLNGAFPIYRVYNHNATLHDWVTGGQKAAKEAKYEGVQVEGVAFYAWDKQVPGTVPVYRISRGGNETKILLTSDKAWVDRILAVEANDPNGWRQNQFGEFIAFYAYPINYNVPGVVNPGDCSIAANLNNPECATQKESLGAAAGTGALPTSNECPTTVDAYLKAAFPSQFSQECQDKWNNFAKDCSKQENFLSERCKTQRAQLETGLAERAAIANAQRARQAEAASGQAGQGNGSRRQPSSNSLSVTSDLARFYQSIEDCKRRGPTYVFRNFQCVSVRSLGSFNNTGTTQRREVMCYIYWEQERLSGLGIHIATLRVKKSQNFSGIYSNTECAERLTRFRNQKFEYKNGKLIERGDGLQRKVKIVTIINS